MIQLLLDSIFVMLHHTDFSGEIFDGLNDSRREKKLPKHTKREQTFERSDSTQQLSGARARRAEKEEEQTILEL